MQPSKQMKQIKHLSAAIALILFILLFSAYAQSPPKKGSIQKLEDDFSTSYGLGTLATLDGKRTNPGKLRVVVEHSGADIADDPNGEFERKVFKNFGQLGRWLKSQENEDGLPRKVTMPLLGCRRGLCTHNFDGGILHNHLYLQKIAYSYRNKKPYIRTIFLLEG